MKTCGGHFRLRQSNNKRKEVILGGENHTFKSYCIKSIRNGNQIFKKKNAEILRNETSDKTGSLKKLCL